MPKELSTCGHQWPERVSDQLQPVLERLADPRGRLADPKNRPETAGAQMFLRATALFGPTSIGVGPIYQTNKALDLPDVRGKDQERNEDALGGEAVDAATGGHRSPSNDRSFM